MTSKQFGSKARDWLLRFFFSNKIPKLWRQAKVVAFLQPGKSPFEAKSSIPISILCHTYKLFERLIFVRLAQHVDGKIIPEKVVHGPAAQLHRTMTTYYKVNQLRANSPKIQVCAFHPRKRDAKRELNVTWNGTRLTTTTPVYLGVKDYGTLSYNTGVSWCQP